MQGSKHDLSATLPTLSSRLITITLLHDIMANLEGHSVAKGPSLVQINCMEQPLDVMWPFLHAAATRISITAESDSKQTLIGTSTEIPYTA